MSEKDQAPYEAPQAEEIQTDLPVGSSPGVTNQ